MVGVNERKEICGVSIGKGTIENLTNKILNNTELKIYPEIGIQSLGEKKIIYIKVGAYSYDVVFAFGKPFKRVGKNTVRMSNDEYKRKILEIHKRELYFDGQICHEATLSDIDEKKVKEFIRKAENKRNLI